jgi:uncharacterized protein
MRGACVGDVRPVIITRTFMILPLTSLYAGLVALLFLRLSFGVILIRRRERIPFFDGGNPALTRAVRAHGNCAEYAPLLLILLALMENGGIPPILLHAFGLALTASRCAHAYSILTYEPQTGSYTFRFWSILTTFILLAIGGLTAAGLGLMGIS